MKRKGVGFLWKFWDGCADAMSEYAPLHHSCSSRSFMTVSKLKTWIYMFGEGGAVPYGCKHIYRSSVNTSTNPNYSMKK